MVSQSQNDDSGVSRVERVDAPQTLRQGADVQDLGSRVILEALGGLEADGWTAALATLAQWLDGIESEEVGQ